MPVLLQPASEAFFMAVSFPQGQFTKPVVGLKTDDAFRVCQPCRQTSGVHPPPANSACFPYGENSPQTIAVGRRKLGTPLAVAMGQTSKCSTVFSPHYRLCDTAL